jgi:hypothetical protein
MDPELSQRLDRLEREVKVIRGIAVAGFGFAMFSIFAFWARSVFGGDSWPWTFLGVLAMTAVSIYYRWHFAKQPK